MARAIKTCRAIASCPTVEAGNAMQQRQQTACPDHSQVLYRIIRRCYFRPFSPCTGACISIPWQNSWLPAVLKLLRRCHLSKRPAFRAEVLLMVLAILLPFRDKSAIPPAQDDRQYPVLYFGIDVESVTN